MSLLYGLDTAISKAIIQKNQSEKVVVDTTKRLLDAKKDLANRIIQHHDFDNIFELFRRI